MQKPIMDAKGNIRTRVCSECRESKTHEQFGWQQASEPAATIKCLDCRRARNAAYQRRRRQDKPETVRSANLWRLYRIRSEEYDALRDRQGRRCAICRVHEDDIDVSRIGGRPTKDGTRRFVFALQVDHCHETGAIRGLLCPECNRGIGHFQDDAGRLAAAARYVRRTKGVAGDVAVSS